MDSTALEAILEVTIGMIFMWLILSVATMTIQEWIASYLKWRATDLEIAIQRLLGNEVWAEKLYEHPLIRGLSKVPGEKPSYIPANKFALALFDIVMTAGTPESLIQSKLLTAKYELSLAPNQIDELIKHVFKRLKLNLGGILTRMFYFLGAEVGTQEQRYSVILMRAEQLFHASAEEEKIHKVIKDLIERIQSEKDPEMLTALKVELKKLEQILKSIQLATLQKKLQKFMSVLINDQVEIEEGKKVPISSVGFFNTYPTFQKFFLELIDRTNLKLRWAEIMVNDDDDFMEELNASLPDGALLRDEVRMAVLQKASATEFNKEELETFLIFIRDHFYEIDLKVLAEYVLGLAGNAQGIAALAELNPVLHKSLDQLYGDIIGIANNTNMLEAVRNRFAIAAVNLEKAEHNLAALRLNSETWFNESMDRLSGWYKRKATFLAFIIGLVLASILNVDSIAIAQHLWKEPTVRQALVANATKFTQENPELPESLGGESPQDAVAYFDTQFADLNVPVGWVYETRKLDPGESCSLFSINEDITRGLYSEVPVSELEDGVGEENQTGIEPAQDEDKVPACQSIRNFPKTTADLGMKILGIILSAGAAAQGAPFWFDILKKLVNVRGSGAKPEEKSK